MLLLWDNWGDERACDIGHWHVHIRGNPWGLPEVVGTVQQVHCSRRRLLRRGLEVHVFTVNKSSHTKKFWKLIVCTSYHAIFPLILISLNVNVEQKCWISTVYSRFCTFFMICSMTLNSFSFSFSCISFKIFTASGLKNNNFVWIGV